MSLTECLQTFSNVNNFRSDGIHLIYWEGNSLVGSLKICSSTLCQYLRQHTVSTCADTRTLILFQSGSDEFPSLRPFEWFSSLKKSRLNSEALSCNNRMLLSVEFRRLYRDNVNFDISCLTFTMLIKVISAQLKVVYPLISCLSWRVSGTEASSPENNHSVWKNNNRL